MDATVGPVLSRLTTGMLKVKTTQGQFAESKYHGQGSESMDDSEVSIHELGKDQDIIDEKYQGQDNLDGRGQCSDQYSQHPIEMTVIKAEEVVRDGEEEQNGRILKSRLQVKKEDMEEDTLMNNGSFLPYPSYSYTIKPYTQQPQNNELDKDKVSIEEKYKGQDNLNEHGQCSDHYLHHPIEMIVLKPEEVVGGGEEEQNGGLVDEGPHVKKEDPFMHIETLTSHSSYRSTIKPNTQEHFKVEDVEGIEEGKTNEKYHYSSTMMQIQDFPPNLNTKIDNFKSENESNVMNTLCLGAETIGQQESSTLNKGVNDSSTGISLLTQNSHVYRNKSYTCKYCDYETNQKSDLIKHLYTHNGERPYSCELCDKTYTQKSHLNRHLLTHTGERPYGCELCDKTYNQKSFLTTHLYTHTGERPYSCEFCDKRFIHKSILTRHLHTHAGERPYSCELCDKTFNHKSSLTTHSYTHTGEEPHSCEFCDKTFTNKAALTAHLYAHTGERPYSCDLCDKTFIQKSLLTRHLLTHTGERPHSCGFCDKRFIQKSVLTRHLLTHTGETPYSCEFCDKAFPVKAALTAHSYTHTGERPYSCELCDKTFSHKASLKRHLYTHTTEERPYSCEVCDFKTANKSHLNTHLHTHTGEKPLSCEFCDFKTAHQSSLNKHMRRHI